MKKTFFLTYLELLLVLMLPGYELLHAQPSYDIKHKLEFTHCGTAVDANIYASMIELDYYLDGKQISSSGAVYPTGKHDFRVVVREKYPREGVDRKFGIKEIRLIALHKDPAHNHRSETHSLFGKDVKIALTIAPLSGDYVGYSMVITIDRCDDGIQEYDANVKVITTVTAQEVEKPFSGIHVEIGDQVVPVDVDGIGWFRMRPGQYTMSYHQDLQPGERSGLKPGAVTLRASKSGSTQQLVTIPRKGNENILECKVPLLKENTGSGNLYDYELKINMISIEPRRHATNEVRLIAVQPGVQVHKAGTPEEQWIEATKDMVLQEGDEISCDPDGAATLQFADMGTTVVKNTTQLKIASYFTEGGVVKTEILLKMGEIAAKVHKSEATKSDFRIKSPSFTSSRRDTWYSHRYDPVTHTDIIKVEEGTVDIIPNNAATPAMTIRTGQQVEAKNGSLGNITPIIEKINFSMAKTKPETKQETKPETKPLTKPETKPGIQPEIKTEIKPETKTGNKTKPYPSSALVAGNWQLTEGNVTGKLILDGSGSKLSGSIQWNNQKKGIIKNGSVIEDNILFVVTYEDGSKVVYTATLDKNRTKMTDGNAVSPNGSTEGWMGIKE